jgi:signal transduction histidine kinase
MVLGVFCVYSDVSHYFVENDVKFFSLMNDLTALSIEKLKTELNKTWFLKKAAHQLRSPSNAIYSMLKTIRKGYLGPVNRKQQETIERCEKRIEILGHVINDLLELEIKRTDISKTIMHPVDSTKIMKALVNLYQTQALEKGIDITFHIEDSLPEIMADEKLADDLFANLISNAIKYTQPGGKVKVALAKEVQHHVRFEVSDTGIGIHEEDIPHLFSEFFRTENAKVYVEEGSGLGLVIVKEILDRLKGTVSVKSKPGEWTCFTILLPSV